MKILRKSMTKTMTIKLPNEESKCYFCRREGHGSAGGNIVMFANPITVGRKKGKI